jgi:peptidoglycan/xylan/chitin deacetylase (PgdA/CDA1 family)
MILSVSAFIVGSPVMHWLATRTIVLTYHDVLPGDGPKQVWFDTTEVELRNQLERLKSLGCTFIDIERLYNGLTGKEPLPPKAVLITFADNYKGFLDYGIPILEEFQVPAVQFVHTGFVGARTGRPKCSWADLVMLNSRGIAIESQTVSHPEDLRKLTSQALEKEFVNSRRSLRKNVAESFYVAYPNGKFDYRVARAARDAGYKMGFTEECRIAESGTNLWSVPRYVHTRLEDAIKDARW